jgi:hypothetical protein
LQHNLTAEAAVIDPGVDLAHGRKRETVDHAGMDGAVAQQVKQYDHVGLGGLPPNASNDERVQHGGR